ncbi:MAG: KUP/HAK/KT family potassium transporter [Ilumatobacteraceae bacterium]|nr:KUP/HAK/KT family potassium transporter [Ilumatobacteraceae bacterium]
MTFEQESSSDSSGSVDSPTSASDQSGDGQHGGHKAGMGALALGALGIVYGDIGTSPLYAFREAFEHQHLDASNPVYAFGVASLAFWALVIIISIKYLTFVMKADNHGEGGILALTAMVMPKGTLKGRGRVVVGLGVFGTALLYGDGLITPAISVLSAVEGVKEATTALDDFIIPIAVAILAVLFLVQKRGTAGIGRVFGPVMMVWFTVLGVLGLGQLLEDASVLKAVNPIYAVDFFAESPMKSFLTLGSIFLVVTGGEALYADMGHFGRRPILWSWYGLVLPGLLLNYFGQASLILNDPEAVERPLFKMAPEWGVLPLVVLATMATVIASQALISGAFSLTVQAVQLDYLPRVKISHTSSSHRGQVYVPLVNWLLMIGCIGLVVTFQSSKALASAYGIAVTSTMLVTTLLFYEVCRNFPLLVAIVLLAQMTTWRRGRQLVAARIHRGERPIVEVLDEHVDVARVAGTAVFMFKDLGKAPPALVNNLKHNKVLHKCTLIVAVQTAEVPRVDPSERTVVTKVEPGVFQILLRFGFMEEPDVVSALSSIKERGLDFDPKQATFFLGHESIVAGKAPGMNPVAEQLFVLLNRGADSAGRFFNLPKDQIFEVGSHVEI